MKLSEMTTDKMLDKICELVPYIEEITTDKEVKKLLADKLKADNNIKKEDIIEKGFEKGLEKIFKFVPLLLKKHRESIYNILSIINDIDIETIKNQKVTETLKQITELLRDEEFNKLFL